MDYPEIKVHCTNTLEGNDTEKCNLLIKSDRENLITHLQSLVRYIEDFNAPLWLQTALFEEVISKEEYDQQMQLLLHELK